MVSDHAPYMSRLYDLLDRYFSLEEIRTLLFKLGVDYESLAGRDKAVLIRELLLALNRKGRLPELVNLVRKERPHVNWPAVPTEANMQPTAAADDSPAARDRPQQRARSVAAEGPSTMVALGKFLIRLLISAAAFWLAAMTMPGFRWFELEMAVLVGALNAALGPLANYLNLPYKAVTLGLWTLFVNVILLYVLGVVFGDMLEGFFAAVLAAVVITIFSWLASVFLGSD